VILSSVTTTYFDGQNSALSEIQNSPYRMRLEITQTNNLNSGHCEQYLCKL